ncbi:MAG: hypothetical protein A2015_08145 [Spirochaetes bacterium GWF1_31_7]|nr:MAG: hypothetical protein A2Y30_02235 [Spirochaetes bacterium GWE1_32_154]OHD47011.1 MAG: hypothetical protein A2015_08145 [Spirochaetes bacterium GWF1_31_7]OHD49788.1 MAG: hypothetical protein A2Y29_06345 [Spirochaetes bacterium GWE2_31_10]OHD79070.1 MAG: hypothetical protein A2355_00695 [Spirochaetes bacterium RIFOXYB1_FULL_32_8]HBD96266.1 hypothetical protein [Spirochaetia bacterium]
MDTNITITIKNYNKTVVIPSGTKIFNLLKPEDEGAFITARVNNAITSLSYSLKVKSIVEFITSDSHEGMEVYRRSLSFLLAKSTSVLYPKSNLVIRHSLGPGYYYELDNHIVTDQDILDIKKQITGEIRANKPISRGKISHAEAVEILKKNNAHDKIKLIETLNNPVLVYYKCDDYFEILDAPLASSTGILTVFELIKYENGFILQFPKRSNMTIPAPFTEQRKIFEVYQKYKELGKALNADNVGSLNKIISTKHIKDFIQVEEALQEGQIIKLATDILNKSDKIKIITIAGPSSSGKTTFSKRLELQLKAHGLKPKTISVDNYFVDRNKTPLDSDGKYDYESLDALNLNLFNEHIDVLLNGKEINPPRYDFISGLSVPSDNAMKLADNEIIIIEGIHCLNEKLTYSIARDNKYKVYISALTQMNIDNINRIPTTDNRVLRRLVRDYRYRGHSAIKTLQMWPSVRKGEERNIFPFQNDADGYFNSALDYELSILKSYAEPILLQVSPDDHEYGEARRLLRFLSYFLSVPADYVPPTSLLREFIGGSFFSY